MTSELEWRRRWKPDLKARPFCPFSQQSQCFLVKSNFTDNSYAILVSDYVNMYYEKLDQEGISKRTKKLNPSIEAPIGKILQHIKEHVESEKRGATYSFKRKAGMTMSINTKLAGLPFVWTFCCQPAEPDMVSENLTVPLVAMTGELLRRQEELVKILANKDREILDYKTQGARISRKHLETVPFDEKAFSADMGLAKGLVHTESEAGRAAFGSQGQDLYRQLMTKRAWENRDPHQELEGESLDDGGSVDGEGAGETGQSWANRLPTSLKAGTSAAISPKKSPTKSPVKSSIPDTSPAKDTEALRRQALERKLQEEELKKEQKSRKKKKMKF